MSSVLEPRAPETGRLPRSGVRAPRHRWGDPVAVGLVAFVVYALHGYDGVLDRDFGVFVYGGEHVAQGVPPYVGIFNSVGPLADAVPGLAIWLGHLVDADPVLSARLFFTALSALCCALLCVLARDTLGSRGLGSRAAGYLAPAVFLTFECFLKMASDGPREKTTMVVLLLGCLILLGRRRWASAGACTALATLTWQPVLAVAVAAAVAAALLDVQDTRRRILARFVVGGLVPSLATVGYFLSAGALRQAVDGFIVVNVRYTTQPSALTQPGLVWSFLWSAYDWTLVLVIGGLVALLGLAVHALARARRPAASPAARGLVVAGTGALAGTVWTLSVVNGGPDLFELLPFAALGVAGVADLLLGRVPERAAVVGAAVLVSVAVVAAGIESVTTRDDRLLEQRADVSAVLGTQPHGATVVTIDAPGVLALAGRTSPVPYQIFSVSMVRYLEATYPGGIAGFVATLQHLKPTFVVVGSSFYGHWPYRWLHEHYKRVGGGNDQFVWYLRRGAGHAALIRARVAHDEALTAADR